MSDLRYYQKEAKSAVYKSLEKGIKNQLLVLATGTGKTKLAVNIIKTMGRVLWITHNEELVSQSAIALLSEELSVDKDSLEQEINNSGGLIEILSKKFDIFNSTELIQNVKNNIGIIKEDLLITHTRITVASIQTLWRRLDKLSPEMFDVIVVDEAHRSGAKTWVTALNHFTPKLRLGLTATPYRTDGMLLGDLFDEIVYDYPIEKGIKDGFLCKPNAIQLKTSANLDNVHTVGGDFNQKELVEKVNTPERNYQVVEAYLKYAKGRPFIAFCVNVQHTIDLCEAFQEKGVKASFVVGDEKLTTDRYGVINDFKNQDFINGDYSGLINCMIATEGFDFQNTGCVILSAPTKSKTKFLQSLGRGLRLKTEAFVKMFAQDCVILDVVDSTTKHRLINTITLDKELPLEDKIFISEENRQKLLDVKAAREAMFQVATRIEDIKVDLLTLPVIKISKSLRMQEPATEKQLAWIAKLGYDIVNENYTKQMCSEIISTQAATDKQIWALKKAGYDVSNGVTVAEASAAFVQIREREEIAKIKQQTTGFNLPF